MGKALIAFLLVALPVCAGNPVTLVDEVVTVPVNQSQSYELMLHQKVATLTGRFAVRSGTEGVRVGILRKSQNSPETPASYQWLYATRLRMEGDFHYTFQEPGNYVLVLEGESGASGPGEVKLTAMLDFDTEERPNVRHVTPERRAAIIAVSVSVFALLITFSYVWLRPALKSFGRKNSGRPPTFV
jgi:hypothetical protein